MTTLDRQPMPTLRNRVRATSAAAWLRARGCQPGRPASILFHAPSFAFQSPGGGETQLIQTGMHLEALGHQVHLFAHWVDRLEDYRLVHCFGMSRESLELARVAKHRGIKVALSPICWFEPSALVHLAESRIKGYLDAIKWVGKSMLPHWPTWRSQLLGMADLIMPNSAAEGDQLVRLFGVDQRKIRVVPNGVDARFAEADPALFTHAYGMRPQVLFVGRVEARKNVLTLIRACRLAGLGLTVIGRVPPGSESYAMSCRTEGGRWVRFLDPFEHDDPMLASAYAAARVFALPSWFETPGLAAMEAAIAGSAVVITKYGCTQEYFLDQVHYVGPEAVKPMARALVAAMEEGPRPGLSARLRAHYSWFEVARRTAEAYDNVAQ